MSRWFTIGILVVGVLGAAAPAAAVGPIVRMEARDAPRADERTPKRSAPGRLAQLPLVAEIVLPAPALAEGLRTKPQAAQQSRPLSFGRDPAAAGIDARVQAPAGVAEVRVAVRSTGALHLRTAWRFDDDARYEVVVPAPDAAADDLVNRSAAFEAGTPVWSAVSAGEVQTVVLRRLDTPRGPWGATLVRVAHFDQTFGPAEALKLPRAFGDSASCQADIACVLDVTNPDVHPDILTMSRSVAFMVMTYADGSSGTCTGSVLVTANYPAPYFLTAYHCTKNAVTLDTYWFYSRSNCGQGNISAAVQVTGGARRVFDSAALDASLLLLNSVPPYPVSYAGWDANTVADITTIIAVHHPRGDVKKASLGEIVGYNATPVTFTGLGTFPASTFLLVDWDVGIVEPGSSGSSVFSYDAPTRAFYTRGTLTGGNITCSGIKSRTYYSRFDRIFPYIAGPLTVASTQTRIPVVEYYHAGFGHYFVTSSRDEIAVLDAGVIQGWSRTGESFDVYPADADGAANVCRFFTTSYAPKSSHFYTPFSGECTDLKGSGVWQFEAEVFSMKLADATGTCPSATIPLYRLYNSGLTGAPNHRYTTSLTIRQQMLALGYVPEGVGTLGVIGCVPN